VLIILGELEDILLILLLLERNVIVHKKKIGIMVDVEETIVRQIDQTIFVQEIILGIVLVLVAPYAVLFNFALANRRSRSASPKAPKTRVGPMMSFAKFASFERAETNPDMLQRQYDLYQIQYCQDASNYFFEKNKLEEWFRERYDPLLQQNIELESREWAISESLKILDLVTPDPSRFLSQSRLGPLEKENPHSGIVLHWLSLCLCW
jgi:hypothetical protein